MVLGRRAEPRAPVTEIVHVRAGEHRIEAARGRNDSQPVVQLGLAVIAAVGPVAPICLAGEFIRPDLLMGDADRPRDAASPIELAGGKRRRDGGHRQRALAEDANGGRGDQGRVDAARESDDGAPRVHEAVFEVTERRDRGFLLRNGAWPRVHHPTPA